MQPDLAWSGMAISSMKAANRVSKSAGSGGKAPPADGDVNRGGLMTSLSFSFTLSFFPRPKRVFTRCIVPAGAPQRREKGCAMRGKQQGLFPTCQNFHHPVGGFYALNTHGSRSV